MKLAILGTRAMGAWHDYFRRLKRGEIALVFSLCAFLWFSSGAPAGMLADRFGARRVAIAGVACLVLALGVAGALATLVPARRAVRRDAARTTFRNRLRPDGESAERDHRTVHEDDAAAHLRNGGREVRERDGNGVTPVRPHVPRRWRNGDAAVHGLLAKPAIAAGLRTGPHTRLHSSSRS